MTAGIIACVGGLVSLAILSISVYFCWTSIKKPPAVKVHMQNGSSPADDYIPISITTLGVSTRSSCPSLSTSIHEGMNDPRSLSTSDLPELWHEQMSQAPESLTPRRSLSSWSGDQENG